jgi:hypothetical protein
MKACQFKQLSLHVILTECLCNHGHDLSSCLIHNVQGMILKKKFFRVT